MKDPETKNQKEPQNFQTGSNGIHEKRIQRWHNNSGIKRNEGRT